MTGFGSRANVNTKDKSESFIIKTLELHANNQLKDAEENYKLLLTNRKQDPRVLNNYGVLCKQSGRIDKAKELFKKSIKLFPNKVEAYSNLSILLRSEGQLIEAERNLKIAIDIKPDFTDALMNLGEIYSMQNKDKDAELILQQVINTNSDYYPAYINLGAILQNIGKFKEAKDITEKGINIKPKESIGYSNMGCIYKALNNNEKAEEFLKKAIDIDPNNSSYYYQLGNILFETERINEAEKYINKSLKLNNNNPNSKIILARILIRKGNNKEAKMNLKRAIKLDQKIGASYYFLSMISNLEDKDINLLLSQKIENGKNMIDKIDISFSKANILKKFNNYQEASFFLKKANDLNRAHFKSNFVSFINSIKSNYEKSIQLPSQNFKNHSLVKSIFTVGLPRSGKTLIESILSCNNQVTKAGENRFLSESIRIYDNNNLYDQNKPLNDIFIEKVNKQYDVKSFVCTTNPSNFIYSGLICKLIPDAKIIYCFRNPLDNILELYSNNLKSKYTFKNSIKESMKLILFLNSVMKKYKNFFPSNIYFLDYDQLVTNPKKEIHSLITWLEWEFHSKFLHPNLDFSTTNNKKENLNIITSSNINQWQNYKSLLAPAINILESQK